ncbi:MAG: radical SAM/SPASM domain-containing protein [Phycisphaerae bacterium]
MESVRNLLDLSKVGRSLWERYGTPAKLENARRLRAQSAACVEVVEAYPWRVVLEPANYCNLRCKACPTRESELPKGMLDPAQLERYLHDLWPFLVQVNVFNWGEPFLNLRLPEVVAVIHSHGVGTHVHSNMNRLPRNLPESLVDAELDFLVASIDGVTQDVYARYREGGSCRQALKNLAEFVNIRHARAATSPKIIWRYLCFPHNLHQIEEAARLAREIGADDFAVAEGNLDGQTWTPEGPKPIAARGRDEPPPYCTDLYDFPIIHWDGTVLPCCYATDSCFVWGDLKTSAWPEAFNTTTFQTARRLARGDQSARGPCTGCFKIPPAVELRA